MDSGSNNVVKGRDRLPGMCPEGRPGLGSGSVPRNLSTDGPRGAMDPVEEATAHSTEVCYLPVLRASAPCSVTRWRLASISCLLRTSSGRKRALKPP